VLVEVAENEAETETVGVPDIVPDIEALVVCDPLRVSEGENVPEAVGEPEALHVPETLRLHVWEKLKVPVVEIEDDLEGDKEELSVVLCVPVGETDALRL